MRKPFPAGAAALLALAACGSSGSGGGVGGMVRETLVNLVTLQQGAVENAKELRGTGPFREYAVAPARMFDLAESALRSKVPSVFPNRRALEITAKESTEGDPSDPCYGDRWSSAVVVMVHPVCGEPSRSKVEVHAVKKGVFKGGKIDWERELPPLLDAAAARGTPEPIHPIR